MSNQTLTDAEIDEIQAKGCLVGIVDEEWDAQAFATICAQAKAYNELRREKEK